MDAVTLLTMLRDLEMQTHQASVRADAEKLGRLLHLEFVEVGRSGRCYTREQVLDEFRDTVPQFSIWSQGYELQIISADVALLRYHSAHIGSDGTLERHTARSSLWQQSSAGWQLRFHQGTPVQPFVGSK